MKEDDDIKISGIAGTNLFNSDKLSMNRLRQWAANNRKRYKNFDEVINEVSGLGLMDDVPVEEYNEMLNYLESMNLIKVLRG